MAERLTEAEVARNLDDYVTRVARGRETFVLVRDGKPVAELRPVVGGAQLGDFPGIPAFLPRLDDDDDFGADIEAAREELAAKGLVDPWQS